LGRVSATMTFGRLRASAAQYSYLAASTRRWALGCLAFEVGGRFRQRWLDLRVCGRSLNSASAASWMNEDRANLQAARHAQACNECNSSRHQVLTQAKKGPESSLRDIRSGSRTQENRQRAWPRIGTRLWPCMPHACKIDGNRTENTSLRQINALQYSSSPSAAGGTRLPGIFE
jgi:hypothetical protein